jgi:opacity protein-like surface antigen
LPAATKLEEATSDTRSGWTIGGGGEYAFTKHLFAFVEYSYYDLGDPQIDAAEELGKQRRGRRDDPKEVASACRGQQDD